MEPPDTPAPPDDDPIDKVEDDESKQKILIKLGDGKIRSIRYLATTTYWSPEGKPISAKEFMERLFGDLSGLITDEDQLRRVWSDPDSRARFLQQLADRGDDSDRLEDIRRLVDAADSDLFDVLVYVLFTLEPKTRHDRAAAVRQDTQTETKEDLKALLMTMLSAYEAHGGRELPTDERGEFLTARYGSVGEAKARLGGLPQIKAAFHKMQAQLYSS